MKFPGGTEIFQWHDPFPGWRGKLGFAKLIPLPVTCTVLFSLGLQVPDESKTFSSKTGLVSR